MSLQMPRQLFRRRCIPPPPPRFGDDLAHRLDPAVDGGEAVLEREGVEQHEAADAPRCGAISLFVGGGDDFRHSMRSARVPAERLRGLIEGVADSGRRRDHAVDALNFEREETQLVGEIVEPAAAQDRLWVDVGSRAVEVPLQIVGLLEGVADLGFALEAVGVEDADARHGVGDCCDALVELGLQSGAPAAPLAFKHDEIAVGQLEANVRRVAMASSLGAGGDAAGAEQFAEDDVDGFFADGLAASVALGVGRHGAIIAQVREHGVMGRDMIAA